VLQQHALHFGAGNVVARAHDHIVCTSVIPKIAFRIGFEGVARQIPSVAHILFLPLDIIEITAASRSTHREFANLSGRARLHIVVNDHSAITRCRLSNRAGDSIGLDIGEEAVQHFR